VLRITNNNTRVLVSASIPGVSASVPLVLTLLLLLLSCSGKTVLENQGPLEKIETQPTSGDGDLQTLLSKFKEISTDTIKVFSSLDFDDNGYRFKGILLDSSDVHLLPHEIAKTYFGDRRFYACFKFSMDDTHTGLILRTPSMYTPSSLKLFVLNTSTNKILDAYIELAETVIQLVEYWDKKTFIVSYKKSPTTFLMWEHQNEDTTEIFYTIRFKDEKFDTVSVVTK
jgi:hypothetical protein